MPYQKLGQKLLQIGAASLLQIRASLIIIILLLLLLLLLLKRIFGFHKIQIWLFTLELKNINGNI